MNICTYNEMIGLPRTDLMAWIVTNFCTKVDAAMGTHVTSILLMLGGYISAENAVEQSASALMMMRIDFSIIPVILLVVIAMCCLAFSRLEPKAAEFEAK